MKFSHLVPKRSGTSVHYHFRSKIPKDLVSYFGGRKQFQISLHDVSNRDTYLVSQTLKNLVQGIYSDIRNGMKDLNLEDIKEILRIEVRKSILFSHQINEGSNKHTERGALKGLEYVLDLEKKLFLHYLLLFFLSKLLDSKWMPLFVFCFLSKFYNSQMI